MILAPNSKEKIIGKVMAIQGRLIRYERIVGNCQRQNCPNATKLIHELDMIKKAASEIIEEVEK